MPNLKPIKTPGNVPLDWTVHQLSDFYQKNWTHLLSYAVRCCGDNKLAEDFVHEAVIKVILASPQLNSESHALAYLKRTISNQAIDYYRKTNRRPQLTLLGGSSDLEALGGNKVDSDSLQVLIEAEDAAIVRRALSLLSPAERAALVMWEIDNRSVKDIARELGIRETSVKHTLSRARASLRRVLTTYVMDEERGLTALDLLSVSRSKVVEAVKNHKNTALSVIILLLFGFFAVLPMESNNSTPFSSVVLKETDKNANEISTNANNLQNLESTELRKREIELALGSQVNTSRKLAKDVNGVGQNEKRNKGDVPQGFLVEDNAGAKGILKIFKRNSISSQVEPLDFIVKSGEGVGSMLLTQRIEFDASASAQFLASTSLSYEGIWRPIETFPMVLQQEELSDGSLFLWVKLRLGKPIQTQLQLNAGDTGYDLLFKPRFLEIAVLLDSTRTALLAQSVTMKGVDSWAD